MENSFLHKFRRSILYPFIGIIFLLFIIWAIIYSTIIYKGDWGIFGALLSNTFLNMYVKYSIFLVLIISINILYSTSKYYVPYAKEPMLIFDIGVILASILLLKTLLGAVIGVLAYMISIF